MGNFEKRFQKDQVWSEKKAKTKKGKVCGYCGFNNHGNAKLCVWCAGDKDEYLNKESE